MKELLNDVLRETARALIERLGNNPSVADIEAATAFLHRQGWNVDRAMEGSASSQLDRVLGELSGSPV